MLRAIYNESPPLVLQNWFSNQQHNSNFPLPSGDDMPESSPWSKGVYRGDSMLTVGISFSPPSPTLLLPLGTPFFACRWLMFWMFFTAFKDMKARNTSSNADIVIHCWGRNKNFKVPGWCYTLNSPMHVLTLRTRLAILHATSVQDDYRLVSVT